MESTTLYYRQADGVLAQRTAAGIKPELPDGATLLTAEAYEAALAQVRAGREAHVALLHAEDAERTRGDYEALRAAGVAEDTARRLSGYAGAEG